MKKRVLLGTLALTFMFSASAFATEVSEKDSESVKSYSYTNEDNFIVKVQEKLLHLCQTEVGLLWPLLLIGRAAQN